MNPPSLFSLDLHIHTALSPCGSEDMTPQNIVNMSLLLGLDCIAITDHNSAKNVRAVQKAAEGKPLLVLAGMELCTSEEIHLVCLFPSASAAEAFGEYVRATLPPLQNRAEVYGRQLLLDQNDEETGEEPLLLITASGIPLASAPALVAEHGGVCYPAHIDRASYSIISVLGAIPPDCDFPAVEFSLSAESRWLARCAGKKILRGSDAHYLESMREQVMTAELTALTAENVLDYIRSV